MIEQERREKVIKGLERCSSAEECGKQCPYWNDEGACRTHLEADALALLKSLSAFKEYFDGLYGQGLDVANYHLNGETEPFDEFYDSAMEEYENAQCE